MGKTSRLSGLYQLSPMERRRFVLDWLDLDQQDMVRVASALATCGLTLDQADKMVENAVGTFGLPLGVATNFLVNGYDVLVPMVVEEPSVIAGASFGAKLARAGGGFHTEATESLMIGQIQVLDLEDLEAAARSVLAEKQSLIDLANSRDPVIVSLHGGAKDIEVRLIPDTPAGPMLVVHLIYDCRDAMGANMVNTACEALADPVERLTGGRVILRILSNLADRRLARARCVVPAKALSTGDLPGTLVAQRIVEAYALAAVDPYRAATHNKGIMNGIDAVVIATGNDWRAVEAGAHAYAAREGHYRSLSNWFLDEAGDLIGTIELPMAVGTVGGATRVHPLAQVALQMLGASSARNLAGTIAAVGLAQNIAALRALATEGIQRGHMTLHARQVAVAAGAEGQEVEQIAAVLVREQTIRVDRAREVLVALRSGEKLD